MRKVYKPHGGRALSYRTVWISDVHLGFRGCRADHLLNFLHSVDCEYLYLVGDIVDIWEMEKTDLLAAITQQRRAHDPRQSQAWRQCHLCARQPRRASA